MEKYNFYNKKYGIKLRLTLDEDEREMRYQCTDMKDEYRDNFRHECKNGWTIRSYSHPEISVANKILWLQGRKARKDNYIFTISRDKCCRGNEDEMRCYKPKFITHEVIEQTYDGLVDALEEVGNDYSQSQLFLDM